jgi:ferredoxin
MEEFTLGRKKIADIACCDALGIMHPIYAFSAPEIVERFVKMLPKGLGKDVFLFRVCADAGFVNDAADFYVKNSLLSKGYRVSYERRFVMPSNFMFPYPPALVKQLFAEGKTRVRKAVDAIVSGVKDDRHYSLWDALIPLVSKLQQFGAKRWGKDLQTTEACTSCGWCAKACPCGNIAMKDTKPVFAVKCNQCMRCVYGCPSKAIKAGRLKKVVIPGGYRPADVLADVSVPSVYVTERTKGYFSGAVLKYLNEA